MHVPDSMGRSRGWARGRRWLGPNFDAWPLGEVDLQRFAVSKHTITINVRFDATICGTYERLDDSPVPQLISRHVDFVSCAIDHRHV